MVGANKILTVSYGTFSCTLEGFDEPFSTMKAIAEYFRDLAADDRYFGAEPPTPDAEMLSRIAEREIQRRVEAKIGEHGVVLRQAEPEAAPQPAPAAIAAAAPVAAAVAQTAAPEPLAAEPEAAVEAPAVEEPVAEVVAEAADDEIAEEPPEVATAESVEAVAEQEPQPEPLAAAGTDESDDYEIAFDTIIAEASEAEPEAGEAQPARIILAEAPEETAEPDSVAAKLARIRAVVEGVRNGTVTSLAEEDDEPEADTLAAPVAEDFGFDLDSEEDAPELRAAEAARATAREAEAEAADEAAFDDEMATTAEAEPELHEVEAVGAETPEAEAAALVTEDEYEDQDVDDEGYDFDDEPEAVAAAAPAEESAPVAEPEDAELLARLSELGMTSAPRPAEPAPAAAEADDDADDDADDEDDGTDAAIAALTAETEEAPGEEPAHQPSLLQRARASVIRLSKVATILGHSNTEEPAREEPAATAEPEEDADAIEVQAEAAHEEDPDVSRLMEEAKTKLEGAETRRRFSAISHLKAAVAATLADRQMKPSETPAETRSEEDLGLYRDDLSKAVRPRRPTADAGSATPRPSLEMRPAPLVLVSEQRVDRPEGAAAEGAVIRPRRIASGNLAVLSEDEDEDVEDTAEVSPESASSFAEFAGRLGATTLTELLEAAAVYTASVEGRPHFSRPHLLRKVEFVSTRNYNREDGLRSFGTLLRQGKIQKISRGQFTVTGSSRFMSEARQVH